MPVILKIVSIIGLLVVAVVFVSSCDRGSSMYRHIEGLPYSDWDEYASSIPVERRLDLSNEILKYDGPTPPKTIVYTFQNEPLRTYNEIYRRISEGDLSPYYVRVLYAIDQSDEFSICAQNNRGVIQDYLMTIYPKRDPHEPNFYDC